MQCNKHPEQDQTLPSSPATCSPHCFILKGRQAHICLLEPPFPGSYEQGAWEKHLSLPSSFFLAAFPVHRSSIQATSKDLRPREDGGGVSSSLVQSLQAEVCLCRPGLCSDPRVSPGQHRRRGKGVAKSPAAIPAS